MARRVRHYLTGELRRRNRCPDCDLYVVAIGNVEACAECGQIVGPSMRFEHAFLPRRDPAPVVVAHDRQSGRPITESYVQGELL